MPTPRSRLYTISDNNMAASSIIENICVNNPQALIEYAEAMEASAKEPLKPRREDQHSGVVTDPERIREVVRKALAKKVEPL